MNKTNKTLERWDQLILDICSNIKNYRKTSRNLNYWFVSLAILNIIMGILCLILQDQWGIFSFACTLFICWCAKDSRKMYDNFIVEMENQLADCTEDRQNWVNFCEEYGYEEESGEDWRN